MANFTNFGTLLQLNTSGSSYTTIAGLVKVSPPKVANDTIEVNTMDNSWTEQISGKHQKVDDLKGTFAFGTSGNDMSDMYAYTVSGCTLNMKLLLPTTKFMTFSGLPKSFVIGEADSKSPEFTQCELEIAVSGSVVLG
jgi:hypothetical protein